MKDTIFFRYQESSSIQNIIQTLSRRTGDSYQKCIENYMTTKSYQFIKTHNSRLDFKSYQIFTVPYLPGWLFALVLTKTNMNHPYMMFLNLKDRYITFLIPIGKEIRQAAIDDYYLAMETTTIPETTAIYILLEKTIIIRKRGIITSDQFSVVSCHNITNCVRRIHEIDKMRGITVIDKNKLKKKAEDFYLQKAIEFLQMYFAMLDNQEFTEAWEFLKGDDTKYFGKQRLNTFFKNTKTIIGHLEIFITLYELFFTARKRLFTR